MVAGLLVGILIACGGGGGTGPSGNGGGDENPPPPPPTASAATAAAGDAQTGTVGLALAEPIVVEVRDSAGQPFQGASVQWSVTSGGGVLSATTTTTNSAGRAQATWILGTTAGGQSARAAVTGLSPVTFAATAVPDVPAAVALTPDTLHVDLIGDTARLAAAVTDRYGNAVPSPSLLWSSADSAIAVVDSTGFVTTLAEGRTSIHVIADTARAEAAVIVPGPVATVALSPAADTIEVATTLQFTASPLDSVGDPVADARVRWSSSDSGVAIVDEAGMATAVAPGEANITATAGAASETAQLRVVSKLAHRVVVSPRFLAVDVGQSADLALAAYDADDNAIADFDAVWTSREPATASVDTAGRVTGEAAGVARIVARVDQASDTATVAALGPADLLATAFPGAAFELDAAPGDTVDIPITLDLSRVSADGDLGSLDLELSYDATVLDYDTATVGVQGNGEANVPTPGVFRFSFAGSAPQGTAALTLVTVRFVVAVEAPSTTTTFTLSFPDPPTDTGLGTYATPIAVAGRIRIP